MNTLAINMAYLPTDQESDWKWTVYLILGGIALAFIFNIVASCFHETKVGQWFFGVVLLCIGAALSGFIAFWVSDGGHWEEVSQSNTQNLIENINQVYDIDSVELPKGMRNVSPEEGRDIIVMVDGFAYDAILTQDEETYEPHLVLISSPNVELPDIQKR